MAKYDPLKPRLDVHEAVTAKIVAAIEAGAGEFQMPWHRPGISFTIPKNALTQKPYRGTNVLSLWIDADEKKFEHQVWATFKQWQELGAQVRKGEKSSLIVKYGEWIPKDVREQLAADGEADEDSGKRLYAKAAHVFNVAQVDGFEIAPAKPRPDLTVRLAHVDVFLANAGIEFREGGQRAFYRHRAADGSGDYVQMPPRNLFTGTHTCTPTEAYESTRLHEGGHWTGAEHRLNRQFGERFGDKAYGFEELVAELSAAFLCAELGITNSPRLDHAQYIAHWLEVLKGDKKAIFTAASHASRAVEYLYSLQPEGPAPGIKDTAAGIAVPLAAPVPPDSGAAPPRQYKPSPFAKYHELPLPPPHLQDVTAAILEMARKDRKPYTLPWRSLPPKPSVRSEFGTGPVDTFIAATGAEIYELGDQAFYIRPGDHEISDIICIPPREAFFGTRSLSAALTFDITRLHELMHWTKAPHRLNRFLPEFRSVAQSVEEISVELGVAFLLHDLGVTSQPVREHARFIKQWLGDFEKHEYQGIIELTSKLAFQAVSYLKALQPPAPAPQPGNEIAAGAVEPVRPEKPPGNAEVTAEAAAWEASRAEKTARHEIVWSNPNGGTVRIRITHERDYLGDGNDHLTIESIAPTKAPFPLTETGYLSHFVGPAALQEADGAEAYVTAWLEKESQSAKWRRKDQAARQGNLFDWAGAGDEFGARQPVPAKPKRKPRARPGKERTPE